MRVSSPIPHHKARIEIIPLIDIMFFLLASFMMVSLSQVHVKGIKLHLPTGISGQTQSRREYVALSVDKDGEIYYNTQKLAPNGFYKKLGAVRRFPPNAKFSTRGDREPNQGNTRQLIEGGRAA